MNKLGLHPCRNPACLRLVSSLSYFCCAPCNDADAGKYEIAAHSAGCDERDVARTPRNDVRLFAETRLSL